MHLWPNGLRHWTSDPKILRSNRSRCAPLKTRSTERRQTEPQKGIDMDDFAVRLVEYINGHRVEIVTDGQKFGWRSGRRGSKLNCNSIADAQCAADIQLQDSHTHKGKGRWVSNIGNCR